MQKGRYDNFSKLGHLMDSINQCRNDVNLSSIQQLQKQQQQEKYSSDFQILLNHIQTKPFWECMKQPEGPIDGNSPTKIREQNVVFNQMQLYLKNQSYFKKDFGNISQNKQTKIKYQIRGESKEKGKSVDGSIIQRKRDISFKQKDQIDINQELRELSESVEQIKNYNCQMAQRKKVIPQSHKNFIKQDIHSYKKIIPKNAAITSNASIALKSSQASIEGNNLIRIYKKQQEAISTSNQLSQEYFEQNIGMKTRRRKVRERVTQVIERMQAKSEDMREYLNQQQFLEFNKSHAQQSQNEMIQKETQQEESSQIDEIDGQDNDKSSCESQLDHYKPEEYSNSNNNHLLKSKQKATHRERTISLPQIQMSKRFNDPKQSNDLSPSPIRKTSLFTTIARKRVLSVVCSPCLSFSINGPSQKVISQKESPKILKEMKNEKQEEDIPSVSSENREINIRAKTIENVVNSNEKISSEIVSPQQNKQKSQELSKLETEKSEKEPKKMKEEEYRRYYKQIKPPQVTSLSYLDLQENITSSSNDQLGIIDSKFKNSIQQQNPTTQLNQSIDSYKHSVQRISLKPTSCSQDFYGIIQKRRESKYEGNISLESDFKLPSVQQKTNSSQKSSPEKLKGIQNYNEVIVNMRNLSTKSTHIKQQFNQIWRKYKGDLNLNFVDEQTQQINREKKILLGNEFKQDTTRTEEEEIERQLKSDLDNSINLRFYIDVASKSKEKKVINSNEQSTLLPKITKS